MNVDRKYRLLLDLTMERPAKRFARRSGPVKQLMKEGKWLEGVEPCRLAAPPPDPRDPYKLQRPFVEFRKQLAKRATTLGFKWQAEQLETAALRLWEQRGGK